MVDNSLKLDGQLLVQGTPEYEEARCRNFALNSHHRGTSTKQFQPSYIAVCASISDVQASVKFAGAQKLTVTVRTGGHNWFGCYLRDDVFLIDVNQLASMQIDAETSIATVGPAVLGNELNTAAAEHGLCFSSGHCTGVPLGGYLLGGGLGWFMPQYGLAAEHIEQVTLVDPQGNVVTTKDNSSDWMWMARGSASTFPGVVVEFQIRLSPSPKVIRCKTDFFPIESYSEIVYFLNDYITNHPDKESKDKLELTVNLATTPPPLAPLVGNVPKLAMVIQTWMADSEEEFQKQVEPLAVDKFPVPPLLPGEFQDYSFVGLSAMLSAAYPPGQHWICRALMYEAPSFAQIEWKDVQQLFGEKAPMGLSHCMLAWSPQRKVSQPGCYGEYSSKGFVILCVGVHGPDDESAPAQNYVNGMMGLVEDHVWKYDPLEHPLNKETFAKSFQDGGKTLQSVRAKLDPQQLFFDPAKAEPSH